jgi:hypothetical protein
MMVVPHGGAGVLGLSCQVVKDLSMVRGRLGALLLIAQSCAHSAASSLGVGIQSGKRGQSVLFNDEQLTMAEKRCSRKRGRRSEHSCFRKLAAAARKERFGAKPGSAVCGEAAPEYEFLLPH